MKKIFLGNLPFEVTTEEVENLMENLTCSAEVSLPRDRKTGKARGFAFATIEKDEKLDECIEILKKQSIKGRPLKVDEMKDRKHGGGSRRDEPENER